MVHKIRSVVTTNNVEVGSTLGVSGGSTLCVVASFACTLDGPHPNLTIACRRRTEGDSVAAPGICYCYLECEIVCRT